MQNRGAKFATVVSLLGGLVVTSLVLGLLGAGLMMPVVAATGAAARGGVAIFDALPGEFTTNPLQEQSRILASDGSLIATPYDENRIIVPLAQIALIMRKAQIAIEDSRFYEHGGVDPQGVGRALLTNLRSGGTQGASTLTQQYVKITLQENALRNQDKKAALAATARNYTRKLQELKYAVTLEKTLTKDQILQGYLNLVYYGGQAYGVEAAARHYFGIKASQLNLPQAATLAGLVQAPSTTDPISHRAKALARRNVVLDRMHTLGLITDKAWKSARASKIVINSKPAQNSCSLSPYPFFCEYVKKWLLDQPALGKTTLERTRRINQGGLTIQTTLNPKTQAAAQQELLAKVPADAMVPDGAGKPTPLGAAAAVIEPGTGNVLAIAQNASYGLKQGVIGKTALNYAVDEQYGASGGFAFGSTAKMFAVATALNSGWPIDSTVFAPAAGPTTPAVFTHSDYPPWDKCSPTNPYEVRNDEGSRNGALSLTDATAFSVNTAFAWLVSRLGACKVRDMMTNLGLHQGDTGGHYISYSRKTKQSAGPAAITLGGDSVSPLTLASSYAAIASGGIYCTPSPVLTITTSDKKLLPVNKDKCRRALSPEVANGVSQVLKAVITKGTGAGNELAGGRPAAGKTGTAGNSTDKGGTNETWFVGSTPQLTTAVWVGTPIDPFNQARLENITVGGRTYGGELFGATIAAPIWKQIMDRASVGLPILDFGSPGTSVQSGDFVTIPSVAGLSVNDAVAALSTAGFKPVIGTAIASGYPAGQVAGTQPATSALRGTSVVILTSVGPNPPSATAPVTAPVNTPPGRRVRLPRCRPGGPTPCR